jgi:hypothetical protein
MQRPQVGTKESSHASTPHLPRRRGAHRLVVSEATVKSHINHLFTKIGARDRAQAVTYAYRHDLASRPGA